MSTVIEFIKETNIVNEKVEGKNIKCFEVPKTKFFSKGELLYIGFMLNMNEQDVLNKINEMKLGRKTIEKVYAFRIDQTDVWIGSRVLLPSLLENDVDLTELQPLGNAILRVSLHFNGVRDVVYVTLYEYDEFRELVITKVKGAKGIVRYVIYI